MNTQQVSNDKDLSTNIQILQANLNKSKAAHLDLLNNSLGKHWDIIAIQEPHQTYYKAIRTPNGFQQVYPDTQLWKKKRAWSALWINAKISTNSWKAIEIPRTTNITAVQLTDNYRTLTVFNIYNSCTDNHTMEALDKYLKENILSIYGNGVNNDQHQVIWLGDFNHHHPI
jgi:exonuclease III